MRYIISLCLLAVVAGALFQVASGWDGSYDDKDMVQTDDHAGILNQHQQNHESINSEKPKKGKANKRKNGEAVDGPRRRKQEKPRHDSKGKHRKGNSESKSSTKGFGEEKSSPRGKFLKEDGGGKKKSHLAKCTSNADCATGYCCVMNNKSRSKVCRPFMLTSGKKCTDSCACAQDLVCYVDKDSAQTKKKLQKGKKAKGICKNLMQPSD